MTMERIVIAVLVIVLASCSALPTEHIVSGTDAEYCEFPHMVFVDIKFEGGGSLCGGTLISKKHVLTAAHCVGSKTTKVDAHFGSTHKLNSTTVIPVKKWFAHPKYRKTNTVINDVAILELTKEVPLGKCISALALPSKGDTYEGTCMAVGWGLTAKKGILPDQLQKVKINVMSTNECQKKAGGINADQHICVGDNKHMGKNACGGDSGGGLVCRRTSDNAFVVAGIASYVLDCDKGLAVYANTANFLDYINGYIK